VMWNSIEPSERLVTQIEYPFITQYRCGHDAGFRPDCSSTSARLWPRPLSAGWGQVRLLYPGSRAEAPRSCGELAVVTRARGVPPSLHQLAGSTQIW